MLSEVFDFTFNIWAVPSFIGAVTSFLLAVLILHQGSQNTANRWFAVFLLCLALWGVSELMGRISANAVANQFWAKLGPPGWVFMSVIFFSFTLIFTRREYLLNNFSFLLLIFLPGFVFLFFAWNTDLIVSNDPMGASQTYYGWDEDPGKFFWVFILWLESYFWASMALLFRELRRLEDPVRKRQTFIIMAGLFIPLVIGTTTDAVLPILKIPFIETAVFFTTVMGIIVSYGILKYKLFMVSPSAAFYKILHTMTEGLLVLDRDYRIDMANNAILEMLGYRAAELVGKHIEYIVSDGKNLEAFRAKGLEPLKERGVVKNLETKFLTKDAKVIPINFSASSIKGKGEKPVGAVAVASDISETKKLVEKLEAAVRELQVSKYELEKKIGRFIQT